MSLICVRNHPLKTDENVNTTLKKGGKNPPVVTLGEIVHELLGFFNRFEYLHDVKKEIEKKYDVKIDHSDCWSDDDIKRAWGKTQRMDIKSYRRKHWAHVILLQVIRLYYYECNRKSVQPDAIEGKDLVQSCAESSLSDSSEEMEADLEYESWEAEEDVWLTDDNKQACGTKEQSMVGSTQDRSTELTKKGKKKKLLVWTEVSGRESPSSADVDNKQACGTEQSITGNTQDRSTQSSTELNKKKKKEKNPATKPVYIRIPFSDMFDKKSTSDPEVEDIRSRYKLIDRVPLHKEIRKRKSYIMSYNNETKNADWVYEILNKSTLEDKCKEQMSFGRNELQKKDFNQGHLAAAANHRWCQEAYHDTFLMSNMIPQNKRLNEGLWSTLEQYCRDFVENDSVHNVHVYTGPIYSNEINSSEVKAMPSGFFKVIIVENKDGTVEEPKCYVMDNRRPERNREMEKELLENFKVNIDNFDDTFKFIERDTKFHVQKTKTAKLTGEDKNGELHSVEISVIISPPNV